MTILTMLFIGCSNHTLETDSGDSETPDNIPAHSGNSTNSAIIPNENEGQNVENKESVVYFTSAITPEGLMAVYEKLGWNPTGKVAVKLSTGEPPASNYLRPELIKDLVQSVNGTIVECNTAYGGSRAQTAMHYQVAKDHGFTDIADFQIQDENGSMTLTVNGGSVLKENYVGKAFADYETVYRAIHAFCGAQRQLVRWPTAAERR